MNPSVLRRRYPSSRRSAPPSTLRARALGLAFGTLLALLPQVALAQAPVVGVAKQLVSTNDLGGGVYDVAFELTVENLGPVALSQVQVTDDLTATFPPPVTWAVLSGPTASGTLTANAGYDGDADQILLVAGSSTLAVGVSASIEFTLRVILNGADGPFFNSATASADGPSSATTTDVSDDGTDPDPNGNGDPGDAGEDDPTPIPINVGEGDPLISAEKVSSFDLATQDNDASGTLTAGDELSYMVTIVNEGEATATAAVFDDTPGTGTTLVAGSVTSTEGSVLIGNDPGDSAVQVLIGDMSPGLTAIITFEVVVDDPLDPGVTQVANQGVVAGAGFEATLTDDPATAAEDDPTVDPIGEVSVDPIPTLAEWALIFLSVLLALTAVLYLRLGGAREGSGLSAG